MRIVRFEIESADNDLYLQHVEHLINKKKQMLMTKQKQLGNLEKHNEFLREVRRDYIEYHNYIVQQKRDQIKALESLNVYIENLTKMGNLTFHNIKDAKFEQERIMNEINSIKRNLDTIIHDINDSRDSHDSHDSNIRVNDTKSGNENMSQANRTANVQNNKT